LVLPPTVKITGRHSLVQDGTLVLQDKVHCPHTHTHTHSTFEMSWCEHLTRRSERTGQLLFGSRSVAARACSRHRLLCGAREQDQVSRACSSSCVSSLRFVLQRLAPLPHEAAGSHLAALMQNTGKIFAFDMDLYRLNTLKRLTSRAGATSTLPLSPRLPRPSMMISF
jgi:hypothetical protein